MKKSGEMFCSIRSYTSTIRKQGYNVLNAIEKALRATYLVFIYPSE